VLQAAVRQRERVAGDTRAHPIAVLGLFRAALAGKCLVASTAARCGAKSNSLAQDLVRLWKWHVKEACSGLNMLCQRTGCYLQPMSGHALGAAEQAYGPRTRAASALGRQPRPVRRRGRGASPGAGRGHRPPNPAAQGPSRTPRATPSPVQLPYGPRGRTVANISPLGPHDRAAGPGLRN
jgi:hypothetical protein